ncbi:MAG: NUDIX domain-containing protein [Proteobacteria bacterium]|nr:MAG: NUDIX domain-containing protein [Pseudomonadota bacterium]
MSRPEGFRKGVCGIFLSENGKILMGERLKDKGQWQLPQGGIEKGESPLQALRREMEEEVGVTKIKVLRKTENWISYLWPEGLFPKARHLGQEHLYYVIDGSHLQPETFPETEEFARFKWFTVPEALAAVVDWKRPNYEEAFKLLDLLSPSANEPRPLQSKSE